MSECHKTHCHGLYGFLAGTLMAAAGAAGANEVYYDYARVLTVSPILQTRQVPVSEEACDYTGAHAREAEHVRLAGDIRAQAPGLTLGQAIREDMRRHRSISHVARYPDCRLVETFEPQKRVVGYRVRYRYGGELFEQRMRRDPGTWVKVRVALDPLR